MSDYDFSEAWESYWADDARTDRDEHDLQVRAWEDVERDRRDRDVGERNVEAGHEGRLNVQGYTTR